MNQKEQIRKELNEYLDKYIPRTELDIYKHVIDFIKKDRKKQLTLTDVVKLSCECEKQIIDSKLFCCVCDKDIE